MIKNDRQYANTRRALERFEAALDALRARGGDADDNERAFRRIHEAGFLSEIDVLRGQLAEYDALRSGPPRTLRIDALSDVPRALIAARIAAGLTQGELAERLALPEAEVARAEEHDYHGATFAHLADVARALGVRLGGAEIILPPRAERAA